MTLIGVGMLIWNYRGPALPVDSTDQASAVRVQANDSRTG